MTAPLEIWKWPCKRVNQIGDSVTGHLSYSILPFLPSLNVDRDVIFPDIIFEGFFGKDCGALSRATRHRLRRSMLFALKVVELLLPCLQSLLLRCGVRFSIHAVPKRQWTNDFAWIYGRDQKSYTSVVPEPPRGRKTCVWRLFYVNVETFLWKQSLLS